MKSIAIIGSGISGLSSFHYLTESGINATLFESSDRIGGHSYATTINNDTIDMGFQVSNEMTYPNLYNLFHQLDVYKNLKPTDMSFSVVRDAFEWGVGSLASLPSLLLTPSFYTLVCEISRFHGVANQILDADAISEEQTLSAFVREHSFSDHFRDSYLYPFTASVWSMGETNVGKFTAKPMLEFMRNHGMLTFFSYQWYYLTGSSQTYIDRIVGDRMDNIKTGHKLERISKDGSKWKLEFAGGLTTTEYLFDNVIFANRGRDVYDILSRSSGELITDELKRTFSGFKNTDNRVTVHKDTRYMPRNRKYWSAWNYANPGNGDDYLCTYNMNILQFTEDTELFATMHGIDSMTTFNDTLLTWDTTHPVFNADTPELQKEVLAYQTEKSNESGLYFCGAYLGNGFHEDGIVSALKTVHGITNDDEHVPLVSSTHRRSWYENTLNRMAVPVLTKMFSVFFEIGQVTIWFPDYGIRFIENPTGPSIKLTIKDPAKLLWALIWRKDLGLMESLIDENLKPNSLDNFMDLLTQNYKSGDTNQETVMSRIGKISDYASHIFKHNSVKNSKTNIEDHYDLSNDMYKIFLDDTMTYSSAYFTEETKINILPENVDSVSLSDAQTRKYDKIIDKLNLRGSETILEIGCGWGGFANRLSERYPDTKWSGVTLSKDQSAYAKELLKDSPNHRDLQLEDYRTFASAHAGSYDRVVSIEMIEAVGLEYLDTYFRAIKQVLSDDMNASAVIQAITIPDHRITVYRNSVDYIQAYIFPGAYCPSIGNIITSSSKAKLIIESTENFSLSYAETLRRWKVVFKERWSDIKKLGFDEYFKRVWVLYFVYCQYGFQNNLIGVHHILLKPSK